MEVTRVSIKRVFRFNILGYRFSIKRPVYRRTVKWEDESKWVVKNDVIRDLKI